MRLILSLTLSLVISSFTLHKFYVSKTTIALNERTGGFEITTKLFTDDLERALGDGQGKKVRLRDGINDDEEEKALEAYFARHLHLRFNDQPVDLRYVGFETEADLTWCYLEFYRPADFYTCTVENTMFFELFPEQQHIVDLTLQSTTHTVILLKSQPVQTILR